MTSAVGGGSPKSRRKGQNQLISVSDEGGEGKKIRKFCGSHYMEVPLCDILGQNGGMMVCQLEHAGGDDHEGEYEYIAVVVPPP